jgi:glycosyltransferase involved in cell wall biosynthesis
MERVFIYDLTCLIYQQVSETPVGTIRVDLRYAHYFLTRHRESTVFVKQQGKQLLVISYDEARALIEHMLISWGIGRDSQSGQASQGRSNLEFRMEHPGLWSPDLDTFFAMPFRERFNYLLHQDLTEILGAEFAWARKVPHLFKIWYAVISSLWKPLTVFSMRIGQFIGVLLKTGSLSDAWRVVSARRQAAEYLIDRAGRDAGRRYLYVYAAYNRDFPFEALGDIGRIASLECCVFIHDLTHIYYPEYFLPVNYQNRIDLMKRLLILKPDLIANSTETRKYIERFAGEQNLDTGKLIEAHIGVEPCFIDHQSVPAADKGVDYFVVVATIEPRKNHLLLLNLWREMAQKHLLDPMPQLYLVGKRGWENENVVDMVERSKPLQGLVHETANLDDTRLIGLLKGARALLYPTFSEGWGMPVVEALSAGVPVICSDIPELKESGQGIPDYIHPIDGKRWMETIMDYCRPDSALRSAQLQRMARFSPPTWEQHFEQISREFLKD